MHTNLLKLKKKPSFNKSCINDTNILLYNNKQDIFTIDELSFIYLPYRDSVRFMSILMFSFI